MAAGREFCSGRMEKLLGGGEMANWQVGKTIFTMCKVFVLLSKYRWWIRSQVWFAVIVETIPQLVNPCSIETMAPHASLMYLSSEKKTLHCQPVI